MAIVLTTIENAPNGQKTILDGTEKIPISGDQFVEAQDVANLAPGGRFAVASSNYAAVTVASNNASDVILDTELVDDTNLITLAANQLAAAVDGWYRVTATVDVGSFAGATPGETFIIKIKNSGALDEVDTAFGVSVGANFADYTVITTVDLVVSGGDNLVWVNFQNNTSVSLDAYLVSLTIEKLG